VAAAGLGTGAIISILVCIIILLCEYRGGAGWCLDVVVSDSEAAST
jgi:hypothetical protein